jgi:CofD-related protein of GAK system
MRITIHRSINLPDYRRTEICRRNPELGPKILFFSGGSSLRKVSQELVHYTHNSIHIITTMDSGGSSAILRKAFHMPAVGDLRHRLMALADKSVTGNPNVYQLFSHRLPKEMDSSVLKRILESMQEGRHHLVREIPYPMRSFIQDYLTHFSEKMPPDFDLQNASIGNLVITGGYLSQQNHLDPVLFLFSKLAHVRATVKPVTNEYVHLAAELEGGEIIVGQHKLTGKEAPPLSKPINRLFFTDSLDKTSESPLEINPVIEELIAQADLICFPMGSFYSSLIANCLPAGMGEAISQNPCPKVFIPNTSPDPELFGKTLTDQVRELLFYLNKGEKRSIPESKLLNYILMDENFSKYPGDLAPGLLSENGIKRINCHLLSRKSRPFIDEKLLVGALLSLT